MLTQLSEFDKTRIQDLYNKQPGLTCAAIALRLRYSEDAVRKLLRYPPLPKTPERQAMQDFLAEAEICESRPGQCHRCESPRIFKRGVYGGRQAYGCRECGRAFILGARNKGRVVVASFNSTSRKSRPIAESLGSGWIAGHDDSIFDNVVP